MTAYFASPHNTQPTYVTTQISQTWSVKTVTYLIITWAFSSGPLTGSKSLSLSDFLSLLQLSNAAISPHLAPQGHPPSRPAPGSDLPHLSQSLISLRSRWKWILYYCCNYWTMDRCPLSHSPSERMALWADSLAGAEKQKQKAGCESDCSTQGPK